MSVRAAPSNGTSERRTTVIRQPHGSSSLMSDRVMPPPPSTVIRVPNRLRPDSAHHESAAANRWKSRRPINRAAITHSATGSAYTPLAQVQMSRVSR